MADTEAERPAFFGSGLKRWKGMEQDMPFSAEIDAKWRQYKQHQVVSSTPSPRAQCMFLKILKKLQDVGPHQVEFSLLLWAKPVFIARFPAQYHLRILVLSLTAQWGGTVARSKVHISRLEPQGSCKTGWSQGDVGISDSDGHFQLWVYSDWRLKFAKPWESDGEWTVRSFTRHFHRGKPTPVSPDATDTYRITPALHLQVGWQVAVDQMNCCFWDQYMTTVEETKLHLCSLCSCSMHKCQSFSVEVEWLCDDQHFCFSKWFFLWPISVHLLRQAPMQLVFHTLGRFMQTLGVEVDVPQVQARKTTAVFKAKLMMCFEGILIKWSQMWICPQHST